MRVAPPEESHEQGAGAPNQQQVSGEQRTGTSTGHQEPKLVPARVALVTGSAAVLSVICLACVIIIVLVPAVRRSRDLIEQARARADFPLVLPSPSTAKAFRRARTASEKAQEAEQRMREDFQPIGGA